MEIQLWRALRSMGSNSRPATLDPVREFGRFRARRCPTVFRQWVAGDRRGQEAYHQDWGENYHGDRSRLRKGSEPPRSLSKSARRH
jgi:hypothetical protein